MFYVSHPVLTGKDPDAGKDRRQEKGMTEDEMVGWHHWLNRHEFEQAPRDGEGQGSLACCSPWGRKGSDMTERLKNSLLSLPVAYPNQRSRVTFLLELAAFTHQELQWESLTSLNSSWAHPVRFLSRGTYCEMFHPRFHVPTQMQTTGVNGKSCSVGSYVIASHHPFCWWKVNSPTEWHGADKKGFGKTLHHMF